MALEMTGGKSYLLKETTLYGDSTKKIQLYLYVVENEASVGYIDSTYTMELELGLYLKTLQDELKVGPLNDLALGGGSSLAGSLFDGSVPEFQGTYWLVSGITMSASYDVYGKAIISIPWLWNVESSICNFSLPSGIKNISLTEYFSRRVIIFFELDGGDYNYPRFSKNYKKPALLPKELPVKDGHVFLGWSTDIHTSTIDYQPGDWCDIDENITLYAVWKIRSYTIKFETDGGGGMYDTLTKTYGAAIPLTGKLLGSLGPSKLGHSFLGWSVSPSASTIDYQPGDWYDRDEDITLYAVWKAAEYYITYDANGGYDVPDAQIKKHAENLTISLFEPTRPGYIFKGWGLERDSIISVYTPGDTYDIDYDCTLYAIWQEEIYEITYDANGGEGTPITQRKTYNEDIALSLDIPIRAGYRFEGWTILSATDSEVDYEPGATYTDNTSITLYAVWSGGGTLSYRIHYYDYKIKDFLYTAEQKKLHSVPLVLTAKAPDRTGCVFKGWTDSPQGTEILYKPGDTLTIDKELFLYPVRELTVHLKYYANGGVNAPESDVCTYYFNDSINVDVSELSCRFTISDIMPVRNGFIFLGWAPFSENGTYEYYWSGDFLSTSQDISLFAQWEERTYILTINPNGGYRAPNTDSTEVFTIYCKYGETIKLDELCQDGYDLYSYSLTDSRGVSKDLGGAVIDSDEEGKIYNFTQGKLDIIATAQWRLKTYVINYKANGGNLTSSLTRPTIKTHGSPIALSTSKPTRSHYSFRGWSTSADAKEVTYKSGDQFTLEADTTLYAVWKKASYQVRYEVDDKVFVSQYKLYGEDLILNLTSSIPGRKDYVLLGWDTSPEATTVVYNLGAAYTNDEPISLYPVLGYIIKYEGEDAPEPQIKIHGQAITLSESIPNLIGHAFNGWATAPGTDEIDFSSGDIYIEDRPLILYAVHSIDKMATVGRIKLDPNGGYWNTDAPNQSAWIEFVDFVPKNTHDFGDGDILVIEYDAYQRISCYSPYLTDAVPYDGAYESIHCWEADGIYYSLHHPFNYNKFITEHPNNTLKAVYGSPRTSNILAVVTKPTIDSVSIDKSSAVITVKCTLPDNSKFGDNKVCGLYLTVSLRAIDAEGQTLPEKPKSVYLLRDYYIDGCAAKSTISYNISLDNLSPEFIYENLGERIGVDVSASTAGTYFNKDSSKASLVEATVYYYLPIPTRPIILTPSDLVTCIKTLTDYYRVTWVASNFYNNLKGTEDIFISGIYQLQVYDDTLDKLVTTIETKNLYADIPISNFTVNHYYHFTVIAHSYFLTGRHTYSKASESKSILFKEITKFSKIIPKVESVSGLPTSQLNGDTLYFGIKKGPEISGVCHTLKLSWPKPITENNELKNYELIMQLCNPSTGEAIETEGARVTQKLREEEFYLDISPFSNINSTDALGKEGIYLFKFYLNVNSCYSDTYSYIAAEDDYVSAYVKYGSSYPCIALPDEEIKRKTVAFVKVPDPNDSTSFNWKLALDYFINDESRGWALGNSDYELLLDENDEIVLDVNGEPIYTF